MKKSVTFSFAILVLSLLHINGFAQQASSPPFDFPAHVSVPGEQTDEGRYRNRLPTQMLREDRVVKKGILAAADETRLAYASFLAQRNTGMLRLLPREGYDWEVYPVKKKVDMRGGGAFYSFAHLTHAYGYGSDLSLERGQLFVGFAGADYGMLTNLGDVPLTDVTLEDPRTWVLADYRAPTKESKARAEYRRFQQGVTIDGALYKSRLPLVVNSTYLLRSIGYRASDVLVAFRVVRKDTDGSAIILWKRLKRYSISHLER